MSILLPHSAETGWKALPEDVMKHSYPLTYAYLKQFEDLLLNRSGYQQLRRGAPFYILGNTNRWIYAPHKVVWRYIAREMTCSVVGTYGYTGQPLIPDHRLMLVACADEAEAHYVCAALNSSITRCIVNAYTIGTQISTHVLRNVSLRKYDERDQHHTTLAALSRKAHEVDKGNNAFEAIERQIDEISAEMWGLVQEELEAMQESLEGLMG